jgi:hypothetical protein
MSNFKVEFKDGFSVITDSSAYIGNIPVICANENDAISVSSKVNNNNIKDVKWYIDDQVDPFKEYTDLVFVNPTTRTTNEDGTVTVFISLREQNDIEKRLSSLEDAVDNLTAVVIS